MDTTKAITHIGLCAGYGGIELGLKRVLPTLRSVALCEIEAFPIANLVAKMEAGLMDSAPVWTDLKTFPYEEFRDRVDILTGGYPCQPFSAAGKRAGKDDPRHLWPWIADGIRILRPRMCFFENVEGHISLGLSSVISDLEELGYKVSWGIFSAREVGAPHQRKRVFILAYDSSKGLEGFYNRHTSAEPSEYVGADAWASGERYAWPSRPGEPQHAWEPPRVVGAVPAKLANFCSRDSQQGRDTAQAGGESVSAWRESEDAMPHSRSSICGGDQGDEQAGLAHTGSLGRRGRSDGDEGGWRGEIQAAGSCGDGAEAMGNATSQRPHRGTQDGLGLKPEVSGKGYEAMGNAESEQGSSRDHRGESRATGDTQQIQSRGGDCWSLRDCDRQTQPSLGGNADGLADWMDYAELYTTCDNRTDELRLLGNGVVPATAERAFRTLLKELYEKQP